MEYAHIDSRAAQPDHRLDIVADRFAVEIPNGNHPIQAEVVGVNGCRLGPDNPNGVTIVAVNGFAESRTAWRDFARRTAGLDRSNGLDISVVSYDDPSYSQQASYTETAVTVARYVRSRVAGSHEVWMAPHSRGNISVAQAGPELVHDVGVQGVFGMAPPVRGVGFPTEFRGLASEMLRVPLAVRNRHEFETYRAFANNIGYRLMTRPDQLLTEMQEIAASDTTEEWLALGGLLKQSAVAAFYESDGIVPGDLNKRHLERAEFAGRTLMFGGGHMSAILEPETRQALLGAIRGSGVSVAA